MSMFRRSLIIAKLLENFGGSDLVLEFFSSILILNHEGNGNKTFINGTEVILSE